MEEGVEYTPIGIRRINLKDLKRFKRFCSSHGTDDYGVAIGLLLDFYEANISGVLSSHEKRLQELEELKGVEKEKEPKRIKGFGSGGTEDE